MDDYNSSNNICQKKELRKNNENMHVINAMISKLKYQKKKVFFLELEM